MAKLGYTWYPKDWNNSDSVFELNLAQRGLYRELIDLAMLNDNKIEYNFPIWCRRWNIDLAELNRNMDELKRLKLVEINENFIHIPSCESRLVLVRSGKKGGANPKPTLKGSTKGNIKGSTKQTKKKLKEKENNNDFFELFWSKYPNKTGKKPAQEKFNRLTDQEKQTILNTVDAFAAYKPFETYTHPHATTYINQRRWEDVIPVSQKQEPVVPREVWHVAKQIPAELERLCIKYNLTKEQFIALYK